MLSLLIKHAARTWRGDGGGEGKKHAATNTLKPASNQISQARPSVLLSNYVLAGWIPPPKNL